MRQRMSSVYKDLYDDELEICYDSANKDRQVGFGIKNNRSNDEMYLAFDVTQISKMIDSLTEIKEDIQQRMLTSRLTGENNG